MFSYFCAGSITPCYGMVISTSVLLKDNVYCQYQEFAITAWKIESGIFLSWTQNCAYMYLMLLTKKKKRFPALYLLCEVMLNDEIIASTCIRHYQLFGDVEFGQSAWQTICINPRFQCTLIPILSSFYNIWLIDFLWILNWWETRPKLKASEALKASVVHNNSLN